MCRNIKIVLPSLLFIFYPVLVRADCPSADITGDCQVDFSDMAVMASQWLMGDDANAVAPTSSQTRMAPTRHRIQPDYADSIDIAAWDAVSTTETLETTLVMCGTTSARYTGFSDGARGCSRDYGAGTEKDWRGHVFYVRYYLDPQKADSMMYNSSYIIFYDDEGTVNKWKMTITVAPGWNEFTFCPSMGDYFGTMKDFSSVRKVMIIWGMPAGGMYAVLDCFMAIPTGRTKAGAIIQFDDGILSALYGIRYLHKYGFPSIWYISTEEIASTEAERKYNPVYGPYAIWSEIKTAENCGALIASHASTKMPTTSKNELRLWCHRHKTYLLERGYTTGAEYFAIPAGQDMWDGPLTTQEMMDVAQEYFMHIRGTHPFWQNANRGAVFNGNSAPEPWYQVNPRWGWASADDSAQSAKSKIDKAIADKDVYSLYAHSISPTSPLTSAEFCEIVDYIKTKVDEGLLEVITYEDLVH